MRHYYLETHAVELPSLWTGKFYYNTHTGVTQLELVSIAQKSQYEV